MELSKPPMIRLSDFLIKPNCPLPRLVRNLQLIVDGKLCGDLPVEAVDPERGICRAGSSVDVPYLDHILTVVLTDNEDPNGNRFKAEIDVSKLNSRIKNQPNWRHEFRACSSNSPIEFIVTCLVELLTSAGNGPPGTNVSYGNLQQSDRDQLYIQAESHNQNVQVMGPALPTEKEMASFHVQTCSMSDDRRAYTLSVLGYWYLTHYRKTNRIDYLEKAVSIHEDAVQFTSNFHPYRAQHLHFLGLVIKYRFDNNHTHSDIDRAISVCEEAATLMGDTNLLRPELLILFGECLESRSQMSSTTADHDQDQAISLFQKALTLLPNDHPYRSICLNDLGITYRTRHERVGALEDLEKAISSHEAAVNFVPEAIHDPGQFSGLGNAYLSRFERFGILKDLEKAISSFKTAVNLAPDGHPDKPGYFSNLGIAYKARFRRLGTLDDLESAISTLQLAADLILEGHPDRGSLFSNLGNAYMSRFKRLDRIEDLKKAISNHQTAINLTPDGHPAKPGCLSNLGIAYEALFGRIGSLENLKRSISSLQTSVNLTPDDHPEKPNRLRNLGVVYRVRFKHLGAPDDLEKAISNLQSAVNLTPDDHPDKPSRLDNLGNANMTYFERFGGLEDLERAISHFQTAVQCTPDGHQYKPSYFNNLASAYKERFRRLGTPEDLEKAISNLQIAFDITSAGDPAMPNRFGNLGIAYRMRFEYLGNLDDIGKAISNQEAAVKLIPDGHPDKPRHLSNLGSAYLTRLDRIGTSDDLEKNILRLQTAVNLTPDEHTHKSAQLNNLGIAYRRRFERLGKLEDIETAISSFQGAVNLVPDGHPDKPNYFSNLGDAYEGRYERLKNEKDLESLFLAYSTSATSPSGAPRHCFRSALRWARLCKKYSRPSIPAYQCAIDLLPRIAWLGLTVTDQHTLLADIGGAVRDAVAAAIESKDYTIAVEWAEQGRSIVWQNLLGLRTPVDDLHTTHPVLADRLQRISRQLETSTTHDLVSYMSQLESAEEIAHKHSQLAIERDKIIEEIRKIPEYKSFLKPKPLHKLAPVAREGPVVILNVQQDRSDALILTSDGANTSVRNVPLQSITYDKSERLFQELKGLISSSGVRTRGDRETGRVDVLNTSGLKLKIILEILWKQVVKPVIEALAYSAQLTSLPRIWWCPTGPLAFLPIHAAGIYGSDDVGEKVSDYVISSYTPTLSAILDQSLPISPQKFKALIVAQPYSSKAAPIPETMNEVKRISELAGSLDVKNLHKEGATVKAVLEGMKASNWVHLACHGTQNRENPMKSGLLLYDGTLELSTIIKEPLPHSDFAFLSACQTATGDEKVAEESVHLAAGMLMAGYQGVIATMWSIGDSDAPQIAEDVYRRILKDGLPNRKEAAYALQEAVKRLREEKKVDCISWVPFIYVGR